MLSQIRKLFLFFVLLQFSCTGINNDGTSIEERTKKCFPGDWRILDERHDGFVTGMNIVNVPSPILSLEIVNTVVSKEEDPFYCTDVLYLAFYKSDTSLVSRLSRLKQVENLDLYKSSQYIVIMKDCACEEDVRPSCVILVNNIIKEFSLQDSITSF